MRLKPDKVASLV